MTLAILKSDNLVGMEIDAIAPTLPETDTATVPALREIEAVFRAADATVKAAAESKELTALGQREAVKKALRVAVQELTPHQTVAERLAATAAATRTQALQSSTGERTLEVLMIEREVRDRLAGRDPLEVNAIYQGALSVGDLTTVNAIERAPSAFALLTPAMLEQGAAVKLARSPLAEQLAAQEAEQRRYASILATTRTQLASLAARYGLD